jgi:hypothetical protein
MGNKVCTVTPKNLGSNKVKQGNGQLALFNDPQSLHSALAGVRLFQDLSHLIHITLGQLQSALTDCPAEVHEGATNLFVGLGGLTGWETGRAYARLCEQIHSYAEGKGPAPDWSPFFDALKDEDLSQRVTDETSLYTLYELCWEAHTKQD